MGRHNYKKRHGGMTDRYDTDYISLPEYPHIIRINAVPLFIVVPAHIRPPFKFLSVSLP